MAATPERIKIEVDLTLTEASRLLLDDYRAKIAEYNAAQAPHVAELANILWRLEVKNPKELAEVLVSLGWTRR